MWLVVCGAGPTVLYDLSHTCLYIYSKSKSINTKTACLCVPHGHAMHMCNAPGGKYTVTHTLVCDTLTATKIS